VAEVVANRAGAESTVADDNYGDEGPGLGAGSTKDATSGTRVKEQQHAGVRCVEGAGRLFSTTLKDAKDPPSTCSMYQG
jgi:hypothetical protein